MISGQFSWSVLFLYSVISNIIIKNNITTSILHVYMGHNILAKTIHYAINATLTKVELFTIRYGINQAVQVTEVMCIIIITDAIHLARWIFDLLSHPYKLQSIVISQDLRVFFNKNSHNSINFWYCLLW